MYGALRVNIVGYAYTVKHVLNHLRKVQCKNRYNSGIALRKVGILTLLRKVKILTLRKTPIHTLRWTYICSSWSEKRELMIVVGTLTTSLFNGQREITYIACFISFMLHYNSCFCCCPQKRLIIQRQKVTTVILAFIRERRATFP